MCIFNASMRWVVEIKVSDMKSVRKQIIFSSEMAERITKYSSAMNEDFSKFVREASKERIERIEQERLFKELSEGYSANAGLDQETCEDFDSVDTEKI